MTKSDQNLNIVAAAAAASRNDSEEKPLPYLKLIADCWEHVFDYLSFKDILQMGQTCKRMNRMAGYYIREYYPQLEFVAKEGEVYGEKVRLQPDFYPFISRLSIQWDFSFPFPSNGNSFDALKTIEFCLGRLTETQIRKMQSRLKNVEHILVDLYEIVDNIFEQFANYCPKLKHMNVICHKFNDDLLFSQYYPSLECFHIWKHEYTPAPELKTFLQRHFKLKQIHMNCNFFWANRDAFIQSNIQLDLLNVGYGRLDENVPINEFIVFLKILYDHNFYKTLQLSFSGFDNIDLERISHTISTLPQLENVFIRNKLNLDLNRITNLKGLHIDEFDSTVNLEALAKGLAKLEQLILGRTNIETIFSFVRHSKNLKIIKINFLTVGNLDLFALNNERQKLQNACQVSIYVKNLDYMHPKWKSNNLNLELDLVKIERLDSFDKFFCAK